MIWGVGYGVATQAFKAKGYLVKDGVPNIDAYGDFLPFAGWKSESGVLSLNRACYFDTAIDITGRTQIILSNVVTAKETTYIFIGSAVKGKDLFWQALATSTTYKEIKIDISDYTAKKIYLTFNINVTSSSNYYLNVDNITLI